MINIANPYETPRCSSDSLIISTTLKSSELTFCNSKPKSDYNAINKSRLSLNRLAERMTLGTPPTQAYGEPWYWDNRYAHESAPFDWYQKYPALAPLVHLYVPHRHQRILVVGCGNSVFSEDMVNDGYEDVVNVDISSVVIEAMQTKYSNRQQLKYIKMDVRDMSPFQAGSFDAVIDKGTLDSILCGNNSRQNATQMLEEVWRVLKDKGVYILITYGAPAYRLGLLKESSIWSIKLHVIVKFGPEGSSEQPIRELTNPVPLEEGGSSVEDEAKAKE
ncbi:S-adenosyl-L-methionine-dependent methyltransferases superfamily protein isoform 3 [Theobroma cacao]|uniref:S-adenosyl-L-methionine-dependent methyltransferases superfamily protein isoform 3 n=1 Tax=Theobroma cacao TaxID=3641 RepID=A0A061EPU8_THECC|nr:S-adenosyl-L-methionine-dependent methyltransferases superfamily protein isoform 3 [Theobroma cacao]